MVHYSHGAVRPDCITLVHGEKHLLVNVGAILQEFPPARMTAKPIDFRLMSKD